LAEASGGSGLVEEKIAQEPKVENKALSDSDAEALAEAGAGTDDQLMAEFQKVLSDK
jgi:hypothetical protein